MESGRRRILAVRVGRGRRHDFHLWKTSGVRVQPGVAILCDTGYQGLQKLHANCRKPQKATRKRPLTAEQKRANRAVNATRVPIEHASRAGSRSFACSASATATAAVASACASTSSRPSPTWNHERGLLASWTRAGSATS